MGGCNKIGVLICSDCCIRACHLKAIHLCCTNGQPVLLTTDPWDPAVLHSAVLCCHMPCCAVQGEGLLSLAGARPLVTVDYKDFARPLRRMLKQMGSGSLAAGKKELALCTPYDAAHFVVGCALWVQGCSFCHMARHVVIQTVGDFCFVCLVEFAGVQQLRVNDKYRIEVGRLLGVHPALVKEEIAQVSQHTYLGVSRGCWVGRGGRGVTLAWCGACWWYTMRWSRRRCHRWATLGR